MSLKEITIKKKDMLLVDPRILKFMPGFNCRNMESDDTKAHIRKMANAMKENGVANFPAITISQKDGDTYVYAGHCRTKAALLAISEGAPIVGLWAVSNNQTEQERVLDLLTSNDGLPLTPMEKASVVKRLVDQFEWTMSMVAQKLGVTPKVVSDLLILLEAPQEIKTLVEENKISATLAVETLKEDPDAVQTLNTAVENAEKQGKKKATKKHIESKVKEVQLEVKPCPFCGDLLVRDEEAEVWRHEEAYCYLSGATVSETEKDDWNQRVR